jgi:hypothetical protein
VSAGIGALGMWSTVVGEPASECNITVGRIGIPSYNHWPTDTSPSAGGRVEVYLIGMHRSALPRIGLRAQHGRGIRVVAGHRRAEPQWEYACRAGTTSTYVGPLKIEGENKAPVLDAIAWYGGNSVLNFELSNRRNA